MRATPFFTAVTLALGAYALPARTVSKPAKQASLCGQWDNTVSGTYTLYNNLWGASSGTGSQCTSLDSSSGSTIKWSTRWSWSGGSSSVKSYANVVTKINNVALAKVSSLKTTWNWSYTGSSLTADVAYDLFTGTSATGTASYEIMIWLAALGGAGPITSTGSPLATVNVAGKSWKLYKGPNGSTTVFSFVAPSSVENFSADLMDFMNYLVKSQGLPSSQILQSVGAGTEPFTGSNAVLTTSTYSLTPAYM